MADFLLDTTLFIDYYRRDSGADAIIASVISGSISAAYSPITVFELWQGRMNRQEHLTHEATLSLLQEAVLTSNSAKMAGTWLRRFSSTTREAVIRDALIAASAAERGETIYTRNPRDFLRFYPDVRTY